MPIVIDPGNTINDNCVGWWPMDEGAGSTVADVSGNGNDGTLMGAAAWGAWGADNAVELDGSSGGYIEVPANATIDVSAAMTACIWANRTAPGVNGALFHKGDLTGNYGDWTVPYDGSYSIHPEFRINYGGGGPLIGSGTITDNVWHFIAVTFDGSDPKIYIDGAHVATGSYTDPLPTSATPLNIGIYYDVPYAHVGGLANARLWGRCLGDAEIATLYATPFEGQLITPPEPPITASKGRRIARYIYAAPSIENPVGEWIRQREDEEILFL